MTLFKTPLGRFRLLAIAEGISFLAILLITMPLKYQFQMPEPNKVVGMLHGLLFIAYVMAVIRMRADENWTAKFTGIALVASILPAGTFYVDWLIKKERT